MQNTLNVLPPNSPSLEHVMSQLPLEVMIINKQAFLKDQYQKWIQLKSAGGDTSEFDEDSI